MSTSPVAAGAASAPTPREVALKAPTTQASGRVVAEAAVAGGGGYFSVLSTGQVVASGTAVWHGDLGGLALNRPIVGMAATPSGQGYWLVASDGGIFGFGDASFHGSTGGIRLNQPIVGMAATPSGQGYWLVATDGGIFGFGDATFHGSTGGIRLNRPIVGMAATPRGQGYWMVASDGGIFSFGDASFHGSTGGVALNQPIVAMASTSDSGGYWMVATDGGVFSFGDAHFLGSNGGTPSGYDTVGIIPEGSGYWVLSGLGGASSFGGPAVPSSSVTIAALPLGQNPAASFIPGAAFDASCFSGENNSTCDSNALAEINLARAGEGLGGLVLPSGYEQLARGAQLMVVANAERASRGLPAFHDNLVLDTLAVAAALVPSDPTGPVNTTWTANLASGYATPLAADFAWMYDDGPNSTNVDCPYADAPGCWGHREDILVPWAGGLGTGVASLTGQLELTELFVSGW